MVSLLRFAWRRIDYYFHFAQELTKKEDLKIDIASDIELLTDVALSSMMKGESVGISDKYENEYEPVFKVMFKKIT